MADGGNGIIVPRVALCQKIGCKYHRKESRLEVSFFPDDLLVIVKCIECKPPEEILRFKVSKGVANA